MAPYTAGTITATPTSAPRRRALALLTILAAQVLNAFGLVFGGLLLLVGRLGDMLGQLRAFHAGGAVFVLGSLLGGLAGTPEWLIAARVVQGIGAALAGPSVLARVMAVARNERVLGARDSYVSVLLPLLVHAAGIALVVAPGTVAIMHGVPAQHAGSASGLLQMIQQLGGALLLSAPQLLRGFQKVS